MPTPQVFYYDAVDSTNEVAKQLVSEGKIDGLAYVYAATQTAGKGTQGRTWVSPPLAGLYLSIIHTGYIREIPVTPLFTLSAGVACVEMLKQTTGLQVCLKPINDLYFNQCKLGGILTESLVQEGVVKALITGIGINIFEANRPLPPGGQALPVSLEEILPPHFFAYREAKAIVDEMAAELASHVQFRHEQIMGGDSQSVISSWKQYQLPGTSLPEGLSRLSS